MTTNTKTNPRRWRDRLDGERRRLKANPTPSTCPTCREPIDRPIAGHVAK